MNTTPELEYAIFLSYKINESFQAVKDIDCGTLKEDILAAWNVDIKIQLAIIAITIISFYLMISHSFELLKLMKDDSIKDINAVHNHISKSIFYLAGYILIWILSLWLVFVFNIF